MAKVTALEAMVRELELAVLERDVELAQAAGDPCGRRVIEARRRGIDVATRLLPYQTPKLETIKVSATRKDLVHYSDEELHAILRAHEQAGTLMPENAVPANGKPLLEHDPEI